MRDANAMRMRRLALLLLMVLCTAACFAAPALPPSTTASPAPAASSAPAAFALDDLDGKTVRLSDLEADGPVVLFFYKTFCPVSKMAMEKYGIFDRYYRAQFPHLHVVAVGHNPRPELKKFLADNHFDFYSVEDPPPFKVSRSLGVRATPTLILFGQDGQRLAFVSSWDRDQTNALAQKLADLTHVAYRPVSTPDDGLPAHQAGCVVVDLDNSFAPLCPLQ